MVFRGRQGSGSLTWFLLVVVSLLVVVGVRPSPYPTFEEQLPYQFPQQVVAGEVAPRGYGEQPQLAYSQELDFGSSSKSQRLPEIFFDRRSESNRNLQQILRSFPLVVGGPSPSDRVLPGGPWNSLEEATLAQQQEQGTGGMSQGLSKGATLTHLTFSDPRPKRVMCHFKICNLGRRRRARLSSPLQGWLS